MENFFAANNTHQIVEERQDTGDKAETIIVWDSEVMDLYSLEYFFPVKIRIRTGNDHNLHSFVKKCFSKVVGPYGSSLLRGIKMLMQD